jgi:hypothetical protein
MNRATGTAKWETKPAGNEGKTAVMETDGEEPEHTDFSSTGDEMK